MKALRYIAELGLAKSVMIALFLSGAYYYLYFDNGSTIETQVLNLENEIHVEQDRKKETEATIKKEDDMRANLTALARDLQVVKAKIPNDLKDTEMTSIINKAASASGLNIVTLAKNKGASGASNPSVKGSESVEEVVFDISVNGLFNQLVQFLENLANEEKIIKIRDFSIERADKSSLLNPSIRMNCNIIGYKQGKGAK